MKMMCNKKERMLKKIVAEMFLLLALSLIAASVLCLSACEGKRAAGSTVSDDSFLSGTDVVINEVLASNSLSAKAYDGRYYDWVELYNPTANKIALDGYFLSDNLEELQKFSLDGQEIAARGYLLVYCSGLNMTDQTGMVHTNFKLSAANGETLYLSNASSVSSVTVPPSRQDVSYGLDRDGTEYVWFEIPTPGERNTGASQVLKNSVFINEYMISNTFTLYDCEGDYGDWVELYNPDTESADLSRCGLTDDEGDPMRYVFPEGTVMEPGSYLLIFCDGKNKTDSKGMLHTNFSLSVEDGAISLFTPDRILSCKVDVMALPDNISCGKVEGEDEMKLFPRPTPGKPNTTKWTELSVQVTPDINDGVLISEILSASSAKKIKYKKDYIEIANMTKQAVNLDGYTLSQRPGEVFFTFPDIELQPSECVVVYCDGSLNTSDKTHLHAPIKISTSGEDFYLANASGRICDVFSSGKGRDGMSSGRVGRDTTHRVFFAEPTPGKVNNGTYYTSFAPVPAFSVDGGVVKSGTAVKLSAPKGYTILYTTNGSEPTLSSKVYKSPFKIKKNTVIRAAAYAENEALSECVTQTYLVKNPHTIPIVCLSGNKQGLIDSDGIFNNVDNWSERKVHIEYLDESGVKRVEFECGARHFGAYSLKLPQKGIKLSLREIYGQTEVSYPFFNENPNAATTFSTLLLRPSGQDQNRAKLRDELVPAIIRGQIDIDYQEYRACALYVDAQYWGLYYIREHLGGEYLEKYYGYQEGTYDLVKSQLFAQEGSLNEYQKLTRFCQSNDLTVKENYDYICSVVDIDSLIHFWILETYFGNFDSGNIRCYKPKNGGKWRWMIYDMDWAMVNLNAMRNKNYIDEHLLDPEGHGAAHFDNSIIRNLLKNKEFRERFLTLYCYDVQYIFTPERTIPILNAMASNIDNEIKLNQTVWEQPKYKEWKNNAVPFLQRFLEEKPAVAFKQLKQSFKLKDDDLKKYQALAAQYKNQKDADQKSAD